MTRGTRFHAVDDLDRGGEMMGIAPPRCMWCEQPLLNGVDILAQAHVNASMKNGERGRFRCLSGDVEKCDTALKLHAMRTPLF